MIKGDLKFIKNNDVQEGLYEMFELPTGEFELKVTLPVERIEISRVGNNYFDILQELRQSKDLKGYDLLCNGTSLDVYPSAMQLDMGGGEQAYRLRFGFHSTLTDIVNIMEFDEENYINSTVLNQKEYYDRWVLSKKKLKIKTPSYSIDNISLDKEHIYFWGHQSNKDNKIGKSCLSQWWPTNFKDSRGREYKTSEQWMMAEKARVFSDLEILERILSTEDPKEAKQLGREVTYFDDNIWSEKSYDIVVEGNLLKFDQNKELKDYLISTGDSILVEASPYDKIWGIGMKQDDEGIKNPKNWKGKNLLGFALMEVRDLLKEQDQPA